MSKKKLIAYVDGSFDKKRKRYSYGCVYLLPDNTVQTVSWHGDNENLAIHRNVAGEILGAMSAVTKASKDGYDEIEIFYDYIGIENWVTGEWKANKLTTKNYARFMKEANEKITITFTKVDAHTGVAFNELADKLAKQELGLA